MTNFSFKSPNVTIFGGTGFLGRYIVSRLSKLGYIINIVTRNPNEAIFLKTSGNVGQIKFTRGSFSNLSSFTALFNTSVNHAVPAYKEERLLLKFAYLDTPYDVIKSKLSSLFSTSS